MKIQPGVYRDKKDVIKGCAWFCFAVVCLSAVVAIVGAFFVAAVTAFAGLFSGC